MKNKLFRKKLPPPFFFMLGLMQMKCKEDSEAIEGTFASTLS